MLSIVVTDAPDSERVIELINQALIYRFLTRPLDAGDLRTQVESALRWHVMLANRRARCRAIRQLLERRRAPGRADSRPAKPAVRAHPRVG